MSAKKSMLWSYSVFRLTASWYPTHLAASSFHCSHNNPYGPSFLSQENLSGRKYFVIVMVISSTDTIIDVKQISKADLLLNININEKYLTWGLRSYHPILLWSTFQLSKARGAHIEAFTRMLGQLLPSLLWGNLPASCPKQSADILTAPTAALLIRFLK